MSKKYTNSGGSNIPLWYLNYKNLNNINHISAYGPISSVSYGMKTGRTYPGLYGPNLAPYPDNSPLQTGGYERLKYNYIIHPENGRMYSIFSKKGDIILNTFNKQLR